MAPRNLLCKIFKILKHPWPIEYFVSYSRACLTYIVYMSLTKYYAMIGTKVKVVEGHGNLKTVAKLS